MYARPFEGALSLIRQQKSKQFETVLPSAQSFPDMIPLTDRLGVEWDPRPSKQHRPKRVRIFTWKNKSGADP